MNDRKQVNICIVDDEEIVRVTLCDDLMDLGYRVMGFADPKKALSYIINNSPDVLITDIKMPEIDGIKLLSKVKKIHPDIFVIVLTAYGSVKSAVEAIKMGAYDYITKPYNHAELENTIDKIVELKSLKNANIQFSNHFRKRYNLSAYTGVTDSVVKLRDEIKLIANTNSVVMLTGETGTGKDLIANIIHYNSNRRNKPLINVSCAILSKDVIESELFGHEKGAFTGADKERIGRFEQANGGTIYLDDVDDIPTGIQVKLLRILQDGEFERVGGNKTIKVDVRIIASTKVDLIQLVKEGQFREDLFYRLNVLPIKLQLLKNREQDIPYLFNEFLKDFSGNREYIVEDKIFEVLRKYTWPGNTRELRNLVERLVILANDGIIDLAKIPVEYCSGSLDIDGSLNGEKNLAAMVADFEIKEIKMAIIKSDGNKNKAAELLGIPVSTLRSKLEKYCL